MTSGASTRGEWAILWRAIPTLWRVAVAGIVAYRAEMVIWILSATLPLVMLALWDAASAAGPLSGFGQAEFARYFAITMVVRQLTGSWVVWELNQAVRSGSLSPQLLRPVHPLVYNFFETLAAIPWRLVVLVPLLGALVAWRPEILIVADGWFVPEGWRMALFLPSVALAFAVAWLVQALFGMLAFWFEEAVGVFSVHFAIWSFFSGYIVPMALLPPAVAGAARWLPFYASLGVPVDVLLGTAGPVEVWAQLGWVVALAVVGRVMWARGIRRYGAVGA
ncbi:MAG: ABC transporter permease [Myxococcales bacterium]|nr:ABC transporter permease [Myxococcales bacterium]